MVTSPAALPARARSVSPGVLAKFQRGNSPLPLSSCSISSALLAARAGLHPHSSPCAVPREQCIYFFFYLFCFSHLVCLASSFCLVCGNMLHCSPAISPSWSCLPVLPGLLLIVLMPNPQPAHTCKGEIQSRTGSPAAPCQGLATSSPEIVLANSDLAQGRVFTG